MGEASEERAPEPLVELEALIFSARGPATPGQIRRALPDLSAAQIEVQVNLINESLRAEGRPYEIVQAGGGYQFRTRPEFASVIRAAQPDRTLRLSRAALETLAVIGYRQPLTRAEIDEIRAVDSAAVLRSLLDRGLIRIVGRRDTPGRPALYGTSHRFLETFGLKSLRDLPPLSEFGPPELRPSESDGGWGAQAAESEAEVEATGDTEAAGEVEVQAEVKGEPESGDAIEVPEASGSPPGDPDHEAGTEPDGSGTEPVERH